MNYPKNLHYTAAHMWVRARNQIATVGVTEDLQDHLAEVISVDLPMIGDELEIDGNCAALHHGDELLTLPSPLTGRVTEINERVLTAPEQIFLAPYGDGWLFKMEYDEPEEIDMLMTAQEYVYENDL